MRRALRFSSSCAFIVAVATVGAAALSCSSSRKRPSSSPGGAKSAAVVEAGPPQFRATAIFAQHSYFDSRNFAGAPCVLIATETTTGAVVRIPLHASESDAFEAAAPGIYRVEFECAGEKTKFSEKPLLNVVDGRIAFVGKFDLPASKGGVPARASRLAERFSLKAAFLKLPRAEMARLQSGYTLKPITPEMTDVPPSLSLDVAFGPRPPEKRASSAAVSGAEACAEAEAERNPDPIGELSIKAVYTDGSLSAFERAGANAYSDALLACMNEAARTPFGARKGVQWMTVRF